MKTHHVYRIGILVFAALVIFLTFNRHSHYEDFNFRSELWADKAGYYVYLPAALKFNFDPQSFPDSIDQKTGDGFKLDYENDVVLTKYTYGVALLQLPFFCVAELLDGPLGHGPPGFSPVHHWSVNVASAFYLLLGLIYLLKFLRNRTGNKIALLTVLTIFGATHLYYYSIDETGMSHVYSFALFSALLYFLQVTNYLFKTTIWRSLLFGLLIGLIVLIRPTNILFLSVYFFLDLTTRTDLLQRLKRVLHWKTLIPVVVGAIAIFVPQMIYWHSVSGSAFMYSYGDEGFNWFKPNFHYVWFAAKNGLFTFTPFFLLIVVSMFVMVRKKIKNGLYILALFLAISYVFSSWWSWSFGCSFGARSYVEYLAIFSIPVAYAFSRVSQLKKGTIISFSILIVVFILFNLKMNYAYGDCFYSTVWDWGRYLDIVTK